LTKPEQEVRMAGEQSGRRLISSGGPWEARAGYSRAVVIGDACWVAGTSDAGPDGRSLHPDDAVGQAREIFRRIETALGEAGFERADLVRIRIFVTALDEVDGLLGLMGELFGQIRPAATLLRVAELIDPSLIVEIEADAHRA
jgi:enamine deaminase RidA (YjgF/YER057c/UK114 family)